MHNIDVDDGIYNEILDILGNMLERKQLLHLIFDSCHLQRKDIKILLRHLKYNESVLSVHLANNLLPALKVISKILSDYEDQKNNIEKPKS